MSYKTLYRVFRPRNFEDVVGQAHIIDILKKQVESGKTSHAYLFCGPRGTGKTSIARILANALNCRAPKQGSPCGECDICRGFLEDNVVDIVEIDAASHSGVDNIRDLREKVSLLPASGKYKVYIVDEVHMLSSSAFNALLKTLEEPPLHAVFILATTEQRKVPATIISRCQKYDFRRITDEDIISRMKFVADSTGVEYEEEALSLIAQQSEGAMRDALSIMDQCISAVGSLTEELVTECMGIASSESLLELVSNMLEENADGAVSVYAKLIGKGVSPHNLLRDMISKMADLLAKNAADSYKRAGTLRSIEALIGAQPDLRYSSAPSAVVLAAIVRAASNTVDIDTTDMELRIKKLERRVEQLEGRPIISPPPVARQAEPPKIAKTPKPVPARVKEPEQSMDENDWPPWEDPPAAKPKVQKTEPIIEPVAETIEQEPKQQEPAKPPLHSTADAAGSLQDFKRLVAQKSMMLSPAANAVEGIEIKSGKLVLKTKKEEEALVSMLLDEAYIEDMKDVSEQLFGKAYALKLSYEEEAAVDPADMQMQLEALFGADKVNIIN